MKREHVQYVKKVSIYDIIYMHIIMINNLINISLLVVILVLVLNKETGFKQKYLKI